MDTLIRQAAESGVLATMIEEEPATTDQVLIEVWEWLMAHVEDSDDEAVEKKNGISTETD